MQSTAAAPLRPQPDVSRKTKIWRGFWMVAATVATGALVLWLVFPPRHAAANTKARPAAAAAEPAKPVRVTGPALISIAARTPLHKEIAVETLKSEKIRYPVLTVTGTVVARIRQGKESLEDRWQFANTELSSAYADWLRAKNEVVFTQSQLEKSKELVKAQTDYLTGVVDRLRPLAKSGVAAEKSLREAEADLLKAQIEGRKSVFEAESGLRLAKKQEQALVRQISQAGIEPEVFGRAVEDMALVSANVPEGKISLVHEGQGCEARSYAFPDRTFRAHVEALSASVTPDRRTLRVLFHIHDSEGMLRPGMFADVGLGTDARDAVMVPAESLLHIGHKDYVLAAAGPGAWRVTPVRVGDPHEGRFEVLSGLGAGAKVISKGTILLKPAAIEALDRAESGGRAAAGAAP
jgi:hypothetical protein